MGNSLNAVLTETSYSASKILEEEYDADDKDRIVERVIYYVEMGWI